MKQATGKHGATVQNPGPRLALLFPGSYIQHAICVGAASTTCALTAFYPLHERMILDYNMGVFCISM